MQWLTQRALVCCPHFTCAPFANGSTRTAPEVCVCGLCIGCIHATPHCRPARCFHWPLQKAVETRRTATTAAELKAATHTPRIGPVLLYKIQSAPTLCDCSGNGERWQRTHRQTVAMDQVALHATSVSLKGKRTDEQTLQRPPTVRLGFCVPPSEPKRRSPIGCTCIS